MWQTKYALAVSKNLGVGVGFRPCSEDNFFTGRPKSVSTAEGLIGSFHIFFIIHSRIFQSKG